MDPLLTGFPLDKKLKKYPTGLYLVAGRADCAGRTVEEIVRAAVRGGVGCVQVREKTAATRFLVEEAARLKKLLAPLGVPLIINDRADVALAVGADGVHLGRGDLPAPAARKLLGPRALIGFSVETWEEVERAQELEVDYLGVSPVFLTPTKTDTGKAWGMEGLARIASFSRHPLVAIGGLNSSNAASAIEAGADAVAVVSAVCAAPDPFWAARELSEVISEALRQGGLHT